MTDQKRALQQQKANALSLLEHNRLDEARAVCRRICEVEPAVSGNWFVLATVYGQLGRLDDALASYDQVLRLQPGLYSAWFNKGLLLQTRGDTGKAEACYRAVLDIKPEFVQAGVNLGNLLFARGEIAEAEAYYRRAVQHQPDYVDALANLGKVQQARGLFSGAAVTFRRALQVHPDNADLYNELGMSLSGQGSTEQAVEGFRQALALNPQFHVAGSNLLLTLNYTSSLTANQVFTEHQRWGQSIHETTEQFTHFQNSAEPDRRLRIGYLSSDFREHSVASFLESLFGHHDPGRVEIFCYSDVRQADDVTRRLTGLSDHWHQITNLPDREVASLVHRDHIDILVDLSGHTANNRLPILATRPAPLQVTWLGYPNTTGLPDIDYRFTDKVADPEGESDRYSTETLIRLPGCFLCYSPPVDAPPPGKCPSEDGGYVTFGSFNSFVKMTPEVLEVWASILNAVPDSRLLLKNFSLNDPQVCEYCHDFFEKSGIEGERLVLQGVLASRIEHLELYRKMDIALDTFPYNGTTTTCEALWMGIPVVALEGERHAGRVGTSLMVALGLQQLIAPDRDAYRRVAISLAANDALRCEWRRSLREVMRNSPLCDGAAFARNIEAAYRTMWTTWCTRHP